MSTQLRAALYIPPRPIILGGAAEPTPVLADNADKRAFALAGSRL